MIIDGTDYKSAPAKEREGDYFQ